jgi:chromosomal replication initiator protein
VESLAEAADGYRTLDGWISRLELEARLKNERGGMEARRTPPRVAHRSPAHLDAPPAPLDSRTVAAILTEETHLAEVLVTIDGIARSVVERFGVRLSAVRGPGRQASIVEARHVAMHLARAHTGSSFAAIGAYFGGRDAATVRHACKVTAMRLSSDPTLAAAVARLEAPWGRTRS